MLKRLVRADLPRRLARRLPRPLTEALAGLASTGGFVGLRILAGPWLGDIAPYPMAILAVVLAALVAGWRAGAVALASGLILLWYFVVPPVGFAIASTEEMYGLILGLVTGLVILAALALYQREVRIAEIDRQRRINFLGHALREMDHRTKNNFQIVTSLLLLQANRSPSREVREALGEAAERLKAVAAVYAALAPGGRSLDAVRLQEQLEEMCGQIRRGILPDGISLTTEIEPMLVPHETAVRIGILVNELVTNACKHAFGEEGGEIRVKAVRDGDAARIEVADNGRGLPPTRSSGLGTRLVAAFVERLQGTSELRSSDAGTVHTILVPLRRG